MKIRPLDIGFREDVDRRARSLLVTALFVSLVGAMLHHLPGTTSTRAWLIAPFRPALLVVGGVRSALMEAVGAGESTEPRENYDYRMNYYTAEARASRLLEELNSLRATIELPEHAAVRGIIASVTGHVSGISQKVMLVDKGKSSGVAVGNIVLGAVGERSAVIGRVIEVGPNMAKILTIADPTCRIPARISSEGGFVYSGMPQRAIGRVEFVPRDMTVKKGDEVVTSEDGILFPGGMLIGTVAGIGRQESVFQEILVNPAIPFDSVKYVWIARQGKNRTGNGRHAERVEDAERSLESFSGTEGAQPVEGAEEAAMAHAAASEAGRANSASKSSVPNVAKLQTVPLSPPAVVP